MKTFYKAVSLYEADPKERLIAFFDKEEDAVQAAAKQGINGKGDGKVEKIYVYPDFESFKQSQIKQFVRRAENKLTEEEKKALQQYWQKELIQKLSQIESPAE